MNVYSRNLVLKLTTNLLQTNFVVFNNRVFDMKKFTSVHLLFYNILPWFNLSSLSSVNAAVKGKLKAVATLDLR